MSVHHVVTCKNEECKHRIQLTNYTNEKANGAFLPKPIMPNSIKCPECGHTDAYTHGDVYEGETIIEV